MDIITREASDLRSGFLSRSKWSLSIGIADYEYANFLRNKVAFAENFYIFIISDANWWQVSLALIQKAGPEVKCFPCQMNLQGMKGYFGIF